jgi:hypothetical protein
MLLQLDDAPSLETRTRRPLVIAAAIAGATLCPLVCDQVLGGLLAPSPFTLGELAFFGGWAAALGAWIAGGVLHLGLRASRQRYTVLLLSLGAGWLYPVGYLTLCALRAGVHPPELIQATLLIAMGAALVGVPCGLAFGVLFSFGSIPAHRALVAPSHEGPAIAWLSGAKLLAVAGIAALLLSHPLEGRYCHTFFLTILPALALEAPPALDIAWTRHLVLPALPVLAALCFAVRAWRLRAGLERTARALRAGGHPRWVLLDAPAESWALPLRARDRAGAKLICPRVEGDGTYRTSPEALARLDPDA